MIVTYQGAYCLKIQYGDFTLAYNPASSLPKGAKVPRFGSNIVLSSTNIDSCNGYENMTYGSTVPFVINSPGNYEVTGISIEGLLSATMLEGNEYINTVYKTELDGMRLLFTGMVKDEALTPEFRGKIGTTDVLFIMIGHDGFSTSMAYKLAVGSDAKIIVPISSDSNSLKAFLKEAGQESAAIESKLTIKKKDISNKEGVVVILSE
jgi:hypothetical protein